MTSLDLITSFDVHSRHEAFYTGGKVQISRGGEYMVCHCGSKVNILDIGTGKVCSAIGEDEEDLVTSFVLSPDSKFVVVAHRNLLLKQWDWDNKQCVRTWKAIHTAPVSCMSYDSTSTLLATGGSDSTIKVWDTIQKYCTHNLTGHHGVVSVAKFHPKIEKLQLFTAAEDYKIRIWDLKSSTTVFILDSHYSVITSLEFSLKEDFLYSAGRDNVVTIWNLHNGTKRKTIPIYESVEGMVLLPEGRDFTKLNLSSDAPYFVTAGAKGTLKIWNANSSHCVFTHKYESGHTSEDQDETDEAKQAFVGLMYNEKLNAISAVTYDHNILMCNAEDLNITKQFVGYNDDVLDVKYIGDGDSHIAVATNSELVKVFNSETWGCQILRGHTNTVMCLDVFKPSHLIASGSKDNNIMLWKMDGDMNEVSCVAIARGHTNAIVAVALSRREASFIISGSEDCTMKTWTLPSKFTSGITTLHSKYTEKAHDKTINAIDVSPNDKLVATGSMDKTAKLWTAPDLKLVGVFRGHKRGIWDVKFSPVDKAIATASADANICIWSISDFSCVKTFEGHESSVLKVQFLSRGMQLLSSGSDGLLKLWTIKSNECVKTYDQHEDKVWALDVNTKQDRVVTGAGDSTVIVWKDVTEDEQIQKQQTLIDTVTKEQKLANLMHEKKYLKAIGLAITLDQPFKVLNIIKEVLGGDGGQEEMKKTMLKLREDQLDAILRYSVKWNMNSKHCHVSQYVLQTSLNSFTPEELYQLPSMKSTVQALLPYTERHFQRMNRLQQATMFVDYTWFTMNPVAMERSANGDNDVEMEGSDGFTMDSTGNKETVGSTEESSSEDEEEEVEMSKISSLKKNTNISKDIDSSSSEEDSDEKDEEVDGEDSGCDSAGSASPSPVEKPIRHAVDSNGEIKNIKHTLRTTPMSASKRRKYVSR